MKNILLIFCVLFAVKQGYSQFDITIKTTAKLQEQKVFVYSFEGSKEMFLTSAERKGNEWEIKVPERYIGAMKLYFPTVKKNVRMISENQPIEIFIHNEAGEFSKVEFKDTSNRLFNEFQLLSTRKKQTLPYLEELLKQYQPEDEFYQSLKKERDYLSKGMSFGKVEHPYLYYYQEVLPYATDSSFLLSDLMRFLATPDGRFENSGLVRPIVSNFMNKISKSNPVKDIDDMLELADVNSNRGQVILAELLSIFHLYQLDDLKHHYLQKAAAMSCSNQLLEQTVSGLKKVEIGAKFPNYTFTNNALNAKVKSIAEIKADRKLVFFWSTTCSHCMTELPVIVENYNKLKTKGIEVIGIALEDEKANFHNVAQSLPWISDSEIKGWKAESVQIFSISATPTFFLLDENNTIIRTTNSFIEFLDTI